MNKEETIVYSVPGITKYGTGKGFVDLPADWEFTPSGDPGLTRRLKATAPDYWVVKRKFGRKEFNVGLCAPKGLAETIRQQLEAERNTPEYKKKMESAHQRRDKKQTQYQEDFEKAILQFLNFHERWHDLAATFAKVVTEFTTPIGSGTVARTQSIPIEARARAAVIAWMRHNTSDYDRRYIPRQAGARAEVRHDIAQESMAILKPYRWGADAPKNCPLFKKLTQKG